jgi:acetyl esterase/lipase
MKKILFCLLISWLGCVFSLHARAQEIIPLYPDSIPNATGYAMKEVIDGPLDDPDLYLSSVTPALYVYLPKRRRATGAAVLIFPGGGYGALVFKKEGTLIAKAFARRGIAAFIVKYRLPSDSIMQDKRLGPLQDAQTAIRIVRSRAAEWNIDAHKIGVIGFSAGGHLASTLGTHFTKAYIPNPDTISLRPDFMILIYPVISMQDSLTHGGSRQNLLGDHPSITDKVLFSNEEQVTDQTPPTYLTQTEDDKIVSVGNSLIFYEALRRHGIPVEMHLYPEGDHGFVLKLPIAEWLTPIITWMKAINARAARQQI